MARITALGSQSAGRDETVSKEQHAVLWLGFGLIIVKLLTTGQWSSLWGSLKTGGGAGTSPAAPASGSPSGGGSLPSLPGSSLLPVGGNAPGNNPANHGVTGLPITPAI